MNLCKASTILAICCAGFSVVVFPSTAAASTEDVRDLEKAFLHPPESARPWVYWFWLNGNITREGITADLEAMKRVGIGGVLIMEVDQGTPAGPVDFVGPRWRELFKHVLVEAERLGLEVNMNNDAGWNGSGGPWIRPEQSMQKVVFTEVEVEGPTRFEQVLPQPETIAGFYRDIAVLAFPATGSYRLENLKFKACYEVGNIDPASGPDAPADEAIPRDRIIELTDRMNSQGRLTWEVPAGKWTLIRFGHTTTGMVNAPAPLSGRGLECDKLSKEGIEANFAGLMAKLITDAGPAAGKVLAATHIDSWENGAQNWTARMRDEFRRRRGYDLLPYLPAYTGRLVQSPEITERFLWDLRRTISDLVVENYAGHLRTLAHRHGLRLSIEAYGGPCDDLPYAAQSDEPMCEFWIGNGMFQTCKQMASAAHIEGKLIVGAEAFTAASQEKWREHPASIKALGDRAFCDGVNRFVIHRYAMQPWLDRRPGMTMGPWGIHYERTQTWWEQSGGWHEYLSRCQFLLRQGRFVADLCFLQPENSPQGFVGHQRTGYDYDNCSAEAVLARMSVRDGQIVLPDGMSYRLLVLPNVQTMTPRLLRKIKELVTAGASIVGSRPTRSPSLSDYPDGDRELALLADELWGSDGAAARGAERMVGKGRVFSAGQGQERVEAAEEEKRVLSQARYIWHNEAQPAVNAPVATRYFRKEFQIPSGTPIASARLLVTADNGFELWVNGRSAGAGFDFRQIYAMDVAPFLKPGENMLGLVVENAGEAPNPAGLIGALVVRFRDGTLLRCVTDRSWQTAVAMGEARDFRESPKERWSAALELGPLGMAPWGTLTIPMFDPFPEAGLITDVLEKLGVPLDFESNPALSYIHRRRGDMDIFFVANRDPTPLAATCKFRVTGKVPELWDPLTGSIRRQPVYTQRDGRTTLPLWLEPSGSIFVVFRTPESGSHAGAGADPIVSASCDGRSILPDPDHSPTAVPQAELLAGRDGVLTLLAWKSGRYEFKTRSGEVTTAEAWGIPPPLELAGGWLVRFEPQLGAPEQAVFAQLADWSTHSDAGIRHFSGEATYVQHFDLLPILLKKDHRLFLDLGRVEVVAEVRLNGRMLGKLWRPPFQVEITGDAQQGHNVLEVKVINLWPNRMIGDEHLVEDSIRNPEGTLQSWPDWLADNRPSPTGRHTFTTWRLWKKEDQLLPSGLLGPVRIVSAASREIR